MDVGAIKHGCEAHGRAFKNYNERYDMSLKEQVESVLAQVRPMLQADGGDVALLDVTEDGIVKVQLKGACSGCQFRNVTLKHGIENRLKELVPGVKEVVAM
jgi:Fe-S cluster biogenesis protein NfuA